MYIRTDPITLPCSLARAGKYLSTMDKTKSPNFIPPINIMRLESLKEDDLYTGDKPLEFILVPKCPLFGDSTVTFILLTVFLPRMEKMIIYDQFFKNRKKKLSSH